MTESSPPNPLDSPLRGEGESGQRLVSLVPGGLPRDSFLARLWQKSKRLGVWNPDDLDFAADRDDWQRLCDSERDLMLRLTALFLGGEESVTRDILPVLACASEEGRLDEELFLTSFLFEEAKHVDFFHRFVAEVAGGGGDLSRYHGPSYRQLFYEELPHDLGRLATDKSPTAQVRAAVVYHMIVEGVIAETGYHAYFTLLERSGGFPGLRQGVALIQRDEARHLAYGVYRIAQLLAADPALWDVVDRRMDHLVQIALTFIQELFAEYPEGMPFGLELDVFLTYAMEQFQRRYQRLERARNATLAEVEAADDFA